MLQCSPSSSLLLGLALGILVSSAPSLLSCFRESSSKDQSENDPDSDFIKHGIPDLIGHTPLMQIQSLSAATGCTILAKLELANPGGSAKDRIALAIIEHAEQKGLIRPHSGDVVYEGTSGSTGISLAMVCRAKGYRAHICLPSDTSVEKINLLEKLGAVVEKVPPAGIVDKRQYVNMARTRAAQHNASSSTSRGLFADQFENEANWTAHYNHTGPEIFKQTQGKLDVFITGAGTGGTISGVSRFLKPRVPGLKVVLADPQGSGLFNKIKRGVMFDVVEREGTRRRHQVDTLVEGIGINRLTKNFAVGSAFIDDAVRVTDEEALAMARYLVENDGIFAGSSSAVNFVAAVKYARKIGPGHTIVTVICDSGARHLSKFWKDAGSVGGEIGLDLDSILK
ncbi:tryptophan synthase beta subunit-like PLP-dependent enzyme [Kockiozyma suomiensis]|uniref:tryptophan synthase beta subunit-like PLP-dependent enzyme n=1 Tax=Kockiozyma suomiensis TaxID=1337062 RepID=UPI0033431578